MALLATGTTQSDNLIFNSGVITVNGKSLADVDNISITQEFSLKPLYVIGSIKARALRRTEFKTSFKAKVKSFNMALLQYLYGNSAVDGSGVGYNINDGQQPSSITGVAVTCYIGNDTTQPVQFQFTNPTLKSSPLDLKMGDYAESDIEIEATDIYLYNGATTL